MSDLIDRESAMVRACAVIKDDYVAYDVVQALKAMPSVQPEIIHCKDCDWWTKQKDSLQGRCELMKMYPTGGWFCANGRRRTDG